MKKKSKIVGIVIGSTLIVLICAGLFFFSRIEAFIRSELVTQTSKLTNDLYHLEVGKINIGFLNGSLGIKDIRLKVDSARLNYLKTVDSIPDYHADISINRITLKGLDFRKKTDNRRIKFSMLQIDAPQVYLTQYAHRQNVTKDSILSKTPYELISSVLDEIKVAEILIQNGYFNYCNEREKDTLTYSANNIRLQAINFVLDSTASHSNNRILYCDDILFSLDNGQHMLPGNNYLMDMGKLELSAKDSNLIIKKIQLIPQYPKEKFVYKSPNHADWMQLSVEEFACYGIHFNKFFSDKVVRIDSILIQDADYENFKDQNFIKKGTKQPLLHELVQRIPISFDISSIKAQNINVTYEELARNGDFPGLINFNQINGVFNGFTNRVNAPNQYITLVATGKIMNRGLIHTTMYFPVDSLNERFEIKGTMGAMEMASLNSVIEPLGSARLETGHIDGLDFHIEGKKRQANINMQLQYHDLKVAILKNRNGRKVDWKIASSLANQFILKKDNPDKGKKTRRVNTLAVRDPYRSSFNYLWKIFFSGITETVGFDEKKKNQLFRLKHSLDRIKSIEKQGDKILKKKL